MAGLGIDMYYTHKYISLYKEKFPDKPYEQIEANPIIRFLIKKYGIACGVLFSTGLIGTLVFILLAYVFNTNWNYFLLGVYMMMIVFHLKNITMLKGLVVKK